MALALTFGWILASRVWMFRDEDFEEGHPPPTTRRPGAGAKIPVVS